MCGIIGGWNLSNAAVAAYLGLHAEQHRGQESAGIALLSEGKFFTEKGLGILSGGAITLEKLLTHNGRKSLAVLAQNRYPTSGEPNLDQAQPFLHQNTSTGEHIAIVHNGQLNGPSDWQRTGSDSERFGILYGKTTGTIEDRVFAMLEAASQQGSYALLMAIHDPKEGDFFIAAKDPFNNRPLAMAQTSEGGYLFASESSAFQSINISLQPVRYERELAPGEVIMISRNGLRSFVDVSLPEKLRPSPVPAPCFFEGVYFARPDSMVFGAHVDDIRIALGIALAREHPIEADMVVPVPDSANDIAEGYARQSGIPRVDAIIRSHYIGRTFIDPDKVVGLPEFTGTRGFSLARKFGFKEHKIIGKRIILVDDTIVHGNTMHKIISTFYLLGAAEVHVRIGSPPTQYSCFYGINTPDRKDLIAAGRTVEQIRLELGKGRDGVPSRPPTSLAYLSYEPTMLAVRFARESRCDACVTGNYRVPLGGVIPAGAVSLPQRR